MERYDQPGLPLRDIPDISMVKEFEERAFANPSIPHEDRFVRYYDLRHDVTLNGILEGIYQAAHERTKALLRRRRYGVGS